MGEIKPSTIKRRVYDDRIEFYDTKTKKIAKITPVSPNVQKFKKHVKETGNLGV